MTDEALSKFGEVDLVEVVRVLWKRRWVMVGVPALLVPLVIVITLFVPNFYRSKAIILPISSNPGASLQGALGDMVGASGSALAGLIGISQSKSTAVLLSILSSRTLAETVIGRENLIPTLYAEESWFSSKSELSEEDLAKPETMEGAVGLLQKHVRFAEVKERPTLSIVAKFRNGDVASRVVKAYLEELDRFINTNALTLAKRNRLFLENRLNESRANYINSGKELTRFFQETGSARGRSSVDVNVGEADLKNGKQEKETVVKDVPIKVYYDYLQSQRKVIENVNGLLASQYEMARINETREELTFQIIESASMPLSPSGPNRKLIWIATFVLASVLGVFFAFATEHVTRLRRMT